MARATKAASKETSAKKRQTAAQKKVEELRAKLQTQDYVVVEKDGKYAVKKGAKSRKLIAENLTVAGLESWANEALSTPDTTPSEEMNQAIAAEMTNDNSNNLDPHVAYRKGGDWVEPATDTEEERDNSNDEIISECNWDIGKGKCPIGDRSANSAHTFYKGKNLYLVEAKYDPDTWAVYVERSNVASSVQGFQNAEAAAIDAAIKLIELEAEASQNEAIAASTPPATKEEQPPIKGKGKKAAAATTEQENIESDTLSPADNPNTDPRVALTLQRIFNISKEADLVGSAATPNEQVNAVISRLEPMQVRGDLILSDLLDALQYPDDTSRMAIALFLAQNGVEIKFLSDGYIELKTTAPANLPS